MLVWRYNHLRFSPFVSSLIFRYLDDPIIVVYASIIILQGAGNYPHYFVALIQNI